MDHERTHSILFLILFVLLFPCPLSSLQGKDDSTSIGNLKFDFPRPSVENEYFHGEYSLMNESLQISSGATVIFSLPIPKENSSVSFSTDFSFSVQGSKSYMRFLPSDQVLFDAVEFGPLIILKDLLECKNGSLVKTGDFYHGRNKHLTVCLLDPINQIKKVKFNHVKQFFPFLYADFSASKETETDIIKNRSFEISRSGSSQSDNHGKKCIVLGVYAPVLAVMSIFSAFWSYLRKLFRKKEKTPEIISPETPISTQNSSISNSLVGFHKFTYRELSAATKNFHQSQLLGRGRYAFVYRAVFHGSIKMYAVKRFNRSASSKLSFEIEATTIHRLHHQKILQLRGWCDENPDEPLLLFDYMHNKSLHEALWNRTQPLLWPLRYNIAIGVAEALVYLHEDCLPAVIHSDIKEGNVMLDADFNPKLGDFGLAMSVPPYTLRREKTERDPPECQPCEEVTEKLDVYLYGSMLLGICCRRTEQLRKFYFKLQDLKCQGRLLEAVDQNLNGRYNEEEMLRLLNVALQCLDQKAQMRPSMAQVLQRLSEGEIEEEPIFHFEI